MSKMKQLVLGQLVAIVVVLTTFNLALHFGASQLDALLWSGIAVVVAAVSLIQATTSMIAVVGVYAANFDTSFFNTSFMVCVAAGFILAVAMVEALSLRLKTRWVFSTFLVEAGIILVGFQIGWLMVGIVGVLLLHQLSELGEFAETEEVV